jgi:hypothetical protein
MERYNGAENMLYELSNEPDIEVEEPAWPTDDMGNYTTFIPGETV